MLIFRLLFRLAISLPEKVKDSIARHLLCTIFAALTRCNIIESKYSELRTMILMLILSDLMPMALEILPILFGVKVQPGIKLTLRKPLLALIRLIRTALVKLRFLIQF